MGKLVRRGYPPVEFKAAPFPLMQNIGLARLSRPARRCSTYRFRSEL